MIEMVHFHTLWRMITDSEFGIVGPDAFELQASDEENQIGIMMTTSMAADKRTFQAVVPLQL